jgi:hypothetical protein
MWLRNASEYILESSKKRIVLSGPSGFLGRNVVRCILDAFAFRKRAGLEPGELVLLSSSPGRMMERLSTRLPADEMDLIRASRVDYFTQHELEHWVNQLGSLRCQGSNSVFVNTAGLAGPLPNNPNAMEAVNYLAPLAAAQAARHLEFGHFIQCSSQATMAERAGQVPYSKHKAMFDFALSQINHRALDINTNNTEMATSIAILGLLYCKTDGMVGQSREDLSPTNRMNLSAPSGPRLNLIDLSLLPWTPILGSGKAPLQPQEVLDAATRIAFLSCTDPEYRPLQINHSDFTQKLQHEDPLLRVYDAVGPETIDMCELLRRFAKYQGKDDYYPVYIDYRNMENILNVKSLGNLNRQFVSLLRSEQSSTRGAVVGDPFVWNDLFHGTGKIRHKSGDYASLLTLQEAFYNEGDRVRRAYPYVDTLKYVLENPRVIWPGIKLSLEILAARFKGKKEKA